MSFLDSAALYSGDVVHTRLRPSAHKLRYRVFSLLLDLDRLAETSGRVRLFSHNRFNLFSVHDRDHGNGSATPLAEQIRDVLLWAGMEDAGVRIEMLCYPRVLGYVFNPLTVYFCYGADGALAAVVYEVNNTFGERATYVVAAGENQVGVHAHSCLKAMYVSPFTPKQARYSFHVRPSGAELVVGVAVQDNNGPLLKTHFKGQRAMMSDWRLMRAAIGTPLLTFKVIAAIHYEALKLFLKGVPVVRRHRSPRYALHAPTSQRQD